MQSESQCSQCYALTINNCSHLARMCHFTNRGRVLAYDSKRDTHTMRWLDTGRNRSGESGGSLEPPRPLLTHLHTVYIAYSKCLPTRLNPPAERTCFSQARCHMWRSRGPPRSAIAAGASLSLSAHLSIIYDLLISGLLYGRISLLFQIIRI